MSIHIPHQSNRTHPHNAVADAWSLETERSTKEKSSGTDSRVVERNAHSAPVMPVVLAYDGLAVQLPEASIVIRASGDKVCRVGAKGAVPDPALVAMQGRLEGKGVRVAFCGARELVLGRDVVRGRGVEVPYASRVIRGAGGEVANVWGEKHTCDVGIVGEEFTHGNQ